MVNPEGTLVATGEIGRSASVHIWDPATLETVHIISDVHTCSVAALGFSPDGTKLASVRPLVMSTLHFRDTFKLRRMVLCEW